MNARIPILRVGGNVLVSRQTELHDAAAQAFQQDVLLELEKSGAPGLVIDISGIDTVDSYVAQVIAATAKMARLMGTHTVLVGMQPVVAATLVRMGALLDGIDTALNLDEGLARLARRSR